MKKLDTDKNYKSTHQKRFDRTINFIESLDLKEKEILDLGPKNPFTKILESSGFSVTNTGDTQDLDLDFDIVKDSKYQIVTGFEILEHMVSPFPLLQSIKAKHLIISVPLKLWFASAYWNDNDPYDCHYHEFEEKQLEMLLNKAGWEIIKKEKWTSVSKGIGIRPILRWFYPRHIILYCRRRN